MIVVDAGVIVQALVDDTDVGDRARGRLHGEEIHAPELVFPEALSVIRRLASSGRVDQVNAESAVSDLVELPILVASNRQMAYRAWQLRRTVTPYDAIYVALAEALGCPLLTTDSRLSTAPGPLCRFEVLGV